jgi:hypothetical protein
MIKKQIRIGTTISNLLQKRLPQRHPNHQLEALSRQRFRAQFCEPLFLVRDEVGPDYGADLSIEALVANGRSPTNIRSLVQLKATDKPPNGNGEYRTNIKIYNIHYMGKFSFLLLLFVFNATGSIILSLKHERVRRIEAIRKNLGEQEISCGNIF